MTLHSARAALAFDERQLAVVVGVEWHCHPRLVDDPLVEAVQGVGLEVQVELVGEQLLAGEEVREVAHAEDADPSDGLATQAGVAGRPGRVHGQPRLLVRRPWAEKQIGLITWDPVPQSTGLECVGAVVFCCLYLLLIA